VAPEAGVRRGDARERDLDRLSDGQVRALEARVVSDAGTVLAARLGIEAAT
jgi:hypothetical protein